VIGAGDEDPLGARAVAALRSRAESWWRDDPDSDTRAELRALLDTGDLDAVRDRFEGRLQFGTAGLRGALGAGPRRMNRLLVRQAAAGLAHVIGPSSLVVVGYDSRHKSSVFAEDSARVFAAAGCRVALLREPGPTPLLAFAIRHLGADAGVMVTASHNPAGDNGCKVYLGDGSQIVPPSDVQISAAIDAVGEPHRVPLAAPDDPAIERLGDEVARAYVSMVASAAGSGPRDVSVIYTPMHGVGGRVARDAFAAAGFAPPAVVAEQFEPDPDFPTVPFPNPEEPGALDLAFDLARRVGADLVLANDPDADRRGVGVVDDGEWRRLSGNEVGILLADAVLTATEGTDRLVVTTIVSSPQLARLAGRRGVHFAETLTGFKWVVRPGLTRADQRFVFGFEEALGYSVVEFIRDKDGISAAIAFAALMARLLAEGRTITDRLTDLAREAGFHASLQWSVRDHADGGGQRLAQVMDRMRREPPAELAGVAVSHVHDFLVGDPLPPTDAVGLDVGPARIVVRPSGTEPKLKCYFDIEFELGDGDDAYTRARRVADDRLEALRNALASQLGVS
jgi:phosphomannomutase